MCCVVTALILIGPRIAIVIWWLINSPRFREAFTTAVWPLYRTSPFWIWPVLGTLFVPYTTLAYLLVFPGGIAGLDWLWLAIGLFIDLSSHLGGGYRHRDRIRHYRR